MGLGATPPPGPVLSGWPDFTLTALRFSANNTAHEHMSTTMRVFRGRVAHHAGRKFLWV